MRQFLVDEFSKFKIEVVELIQYVSKFKTLTMNIQTYLSIALLVFYKQFRALLQSSTVL